MSEIDDLKQIYPYPTVSYIRDSCIACYVSESNDESGGGEETCKIQCQVQCFTGNFCKMGMGYCQQNQYVTSRYEFPSFAELGPYCTEQDEFIYKSWTADFWNKYHTAIHRGEDFTGGRGYMIDNAFAAAGYKNTVGSHSGGNTVSYKNSIDKTKVEKEEVIKATNYNTLIQRLNLYKFDEESITAKNGSEQQILPPLEVKKDDLITKYKAITLKDGYQKAKFDTNLCDFCVSGAQTFCGCSCSCPCSCSCGCSCSCSSANGKGSVGVSAQGVLTITGTGYGGVSSTTLNNTTTKINAATAINQAIKDLQGTSASVSVTVTDSNGKNFTISGITASTPPVSSVDNIHFNVSAGEGEQAPGSGEKTPSPNGEGDFSKLTGNSKCLVICQTRETLK